MNALISAFKDKQKIMFANEGRLLKKSFFGLLILALAFQTGDFGNVIRQSMVDAYLAVSVFVGFTLIVFIGLDSLTNFDIGYFLGGQDKYENVPTIDSRNYLGKYILNDKSNSRIEFINKKPFLISHGIQNKIFNIHVHNKKLINYL